MAGRSRWFDKKFRRHASENDSADCLAMYAFVTFSASPKYYAKDEIGTAKEGTLEFFLVERYVLFAYDAAGEQLYSGRVYHSPYSLGNVDVLEYSHGVAEFAGFYCPEHPLDHTMLSRGVDVEIFAVEKLNVIRGLETFYIFT